MKTWKANFFVLFVFILSASILFDGANHSSYCLTDKFEEILATFKEATSDMIDVTLVEQDGGGEGGAEDCHSVLKIGSKFLKFHYSYQSYSGFYFWDENPCVEVRPQKVEVIQYR
jgi:hypothetical protein